MVINMETIWDKRFDGNFLKIVAIITMLIDHIGVVFLSSSDNYDLYRVCRMIGRISFPIFCFLLTEGFYYTRDKVKYIKRLFLFAIISEIPFDLAFYHSVVALYMQNVMWTLLIGFVVMSLMERYCNQMFLKYVIAAVGCVLTYIMQTDYNVFGILLIVILYITRYDRKRQHIFMTLAILCSGKFEAFGILCMPFILAYDEDKERMKLPKYVSYVFYPAHLLILFIIWRLMGL